MEFLKRSFIKCCIKIVNTLPNGENIKDEILKDERAEYGKSIIKELSKE